jgi:hypothetical protein
MRVAVLSELFVPDPDKIDREIAVIKNCREDV